MEVFINSKNFLVKYLILELFEKLHRLKKYINTCEKFDRKNNSDKIIRLFNHSIEIIGKEVDNLCKYVDSDLLDAEKFAIILKISQNTSAIVKIHEELGNLHSSWILPEIKTFTNEVIGDVDLKRNKINIILSDNYSFLERNLGKKFEASLQQVYSNYYLQDSITDNHSFILPKIEFSNPLNWTIIVHEAGHLQREIIEKLKENEDIMPDNIQSLNRKIIKNWAEEIFCDVYAASILGPAYFLSFITFALLNTMDYGMSSHSEMHPSIVLRASIIINYLENNELLFKREWGQIDYASIFSQSLFNQISVFNDEPKSPIEGLTKFNSKLRKAVKALDLTTFSIHKQDCERISLLVDNLKKGIPVGSVCDDNTKQWQTAINSNNCDKTMIDDIKSKISERSCKVWEILNAGWIFKLENTCAIGEKIFFKDDERPIVEKINDYGKAIDFLDDRLLSSINSSQIIKIIEGNNGIIR